ncbi:MAG: hypothetical protein JO166_10280 [Deltaproteobacteria bacterium]|nr:hypothetical protein [Deltaproteobacteria bacterium]
MKFFVWLKDTSITKPELRQFLQAPPEWFVRCDAEGNDNPRGHYWAVRREVSGEDERKSVDRDEAILQEIA